MIVSTPSAHHPQAEVTLADPQTGVIGYRWLDIDGNPVDSGGSIAYATPTVPGEDGTYPDLTAEAILAAIVNPPVAPVAVPASVPAWRLHAVAEIAGLTAAIEAFIAALPYAANVVASKAWSQGNVIERHSLTVEALITAGIVTAEQADDLFRQAAALTV